MTASFRVPPAGEDVIGRCLAGDDAAWGELVAKYERLIYAVPRRMGLSPEDCADVFQTVCIALYTNLGRIRDTDRLPGWLVQTARREAWLTARRRRRTVVLGTRDDDDRHSEAVPDDAPLADEVCADLERAQILWESLEELSVQCRTLLSELLRAGPSPDYATVATKLGVPRGSLGPTRGRCLEKLERILRRRGMTG
jgi:RNA polymerase sigma factor (sigma-70 family)